MKQQLNEEFRRMQKLAGIITESQYKREIEEISLSGPLEKIKNLIINSKTFNNFIDAVVSKMSEKDKANFKNKFNISESKGGPSLEDIMSKVEATNPDQNAKEPEDLKEGLDKESFTEKVVNLVRNLTGLNLLFLGGAPLGLLINSILGIGSFSFAGFVGPLISLVVSMIIHGISRKLLGMDDDSPLVGD